MRMCITSLGNECTSDKLCRECCASIQPTWNHLPSQNARDPQKSDATDHSQVFIEGAHYSTALRKPPPILGHFRRVLCFQECGLELLQETLASDLRESLVHPREIWGIALVNPRLRREAPSTSSSSNTEKRVPYIQLLN